MSGMLCENTGFFPSTYIRIYSQICMDTYQMNIRLGLLVSKSGIGYIFKCPFPLT